MKLNQCIFTFSKQNKHPGHVLVNLYIYITSPAEPLGLINIDAAFEVGQKVQATEEQKNSCHSSHFFDKLKLFSIWPFVKY